MVKCEAHTPLVRSLKLTENNLNTFEIVLILYDNYLQEKNE